MAPSTSWHPETYARNARFVSDLGEPLLELLAPRTGEWIADLGCGDGALTEKIAAKGSFAIGIDGSPALLHAAKQRGLQVARMDGECLALKPRFDAVFSNAALHWMKRPEAVIAGVARCLKPRGRFVGELGGEGNVATIRAALHAALRRRGIDPWSLDPWYFPAAEKYAALLAQFGFTVQYIELIPRPTPLPGDIRDWLAVFAQPFSGAIVEPERQLFVDEIRAAVQSALRQADGSWRADYVRLRFQAVRNEAA